MARSFKRQFQPSVSSYFHTAAAANDTGKPFSAPATPSPYPALPPTIQSSLLSVGMRVRKSVPEGYQNISKAGPVSVNSLYDTCVSMAMDGAGGSTHLGEKLGSGYRGLMPYCGMLKVGGHAVQHVPEEEDIPPLQFDDEWSLPSGSQESAASSSAAFPANASAIDVVSLSTQPCPYTSPSSARKRRREDADDEDLGLESRPVSPRSRPISHTRMPNLDLIRPINMPRTRRRSGEKDVNDGGGGGQLGEAEMVDVGDFDEAPFFRAEEWGANWVGLEGLQ